MQQYAEAEPCRVVSVGARSPFAVCLRKMISVIWVEPHPLVKVVQSSSHSNQTYSAGVQYNIYSIYKIQVQQRGLLLEWE